MDFEKYVDYSDILIDTNISYSVGDNVYNAHFAKVDDDDGLWIFKDGKTSWTANDTSDLLLIDSKSIISIEY